MKKVTTALLITCVVLLTACVAMGIIFIVQQNKSAEPDPSTFSEPLEENSTKREVKGGSSSSAANDNIDPPTTSFTGARISGYNTNRIDKSVKSADGMTAEWYFDVVEFYGDDEVLCNTLNDLVSSMADQYFADDESVNFGLSIFKSYSSSEPTSVVFRLSPCQLTHVYYDDTYVSIGWFQPWFAGGMVNYAWKCFNINISTMRMVNIYDILGNNARDLIGNGVASSWAGSDPNLRWDEYDISNATFFFDNENVYVRFKSYEIGQTTGAGIEISIPRNGQNYMPNTPDNESNISADNDKPLDSEPVVEDWWDWDVSADMKTLTISGYGFPHSGNCRNEKPNGYYNYSEYIETIIIEDGIRMIGPYYSKNNYRSEYDNGVNISFEKFKHVTEIRLPNSLELIGMYCFSDCESLKSISIPDSVTEIQCGAFWNTSLESLSLPKSLIEVGDFAFAGGQFWNISVPSGTKYIGEAAFTSKADTVYIWLPSSIETFKASRSSSMYSVDGQHFEKYFEGTLYDWVGLGFNDSDSMHYEVSEQAFFEMISDADFINENQYVDPLTLTEYYTVTANDTLASVISHHYGNIHFGDELAISVMYYNGFDYLNGDYIYEGLVLVLPPLSELEPFYWDEYTGEVNIY